MMYIDPYRFGSQSLIGSDPYWSNVVSLLHFDQTGSQPAVDETGRLWNAPTDGYHAPPSLFGKSAGFLNNTFIITVDNTNLDMGTNDFTLEISFYSTLSVQPGYSILCGSNRYGWGTGATCIGHNPGENFFSFYCYDINVSTHVGRWANGYTPNTWVRLALVRQGTTFYGFRDGILDWTSINQVGPVNFGNGNLAIGWSAINSVGVNGYVDEFRLTKGVARYTSSYVIDNNPFPDY